MLSKNKNICIVAPALGGGGAERVASAQSFMLQSLGYNIFMVSVLDDVRYPFVGKLLNLGLKSGVRDTFFNKIKRQYILRRFLKRNNIDVVIDHRVRSSILSELLTSVYTYRNKERIYYIHSYKLSTYLPKKSVLTNYVFNRVFKIITVSKAIADSVERLYGYKNTETIYNPISFTDINNYLEEEVKLNFDYILYYGRLVDSSKNIKLLLDAYVASHLPKKGVKLMLLGDGPDKEMLLLTVKKLGLSKMVVFKSFSENPFPIVKKAKFAVLTSRHEGFPMVLVEALSCGTPLVSVDCKSGPSEIIINEFNGLLVENYNPLVFAEAMDRFLEDKELYEACKNNAKMSISHLEDKVISKQWETLLKSI